jgi:hypothetical protein
LKSTRGRSTDNEFSPSRRLSRRVAVVLMFGIGLATTLQSGDLPLWSRGFSFHPTSGYTLENRFSLRGITQTGLHLTGECAYYQLENQIPRIISIEGTKTADGQFWPDVTSQVKNERTGKWETIAKPIRSGPRATITVKPGEFNPELLVTLDVFYARIGKYKLGRLLLKTGDSAEFELKDLLPSEEEREAGSGSANRARISTGPWRQSPVQQSKLKSDSVERAHGNPVGSTDESRLLVSQIDSAGAADRKALDETVRMLSKEQAQLKYDVKEIPACVLQGLGRWTQTRFVIINWNQSFPPVEDISHTGDGQYRMLFFARLSPDKTLLCFQNNTGVGAAYHGLVFVRQNETCDMMYQFAFAGPVWSMKDLRSAIIENANYQLERDRQAAERQGGTETSRSEELAQNVDGPVLERSMTASKAIADTRLGSSINDFLSLWGPPSDEESLVRTASLKWNCPVVNGESVVDAYAVKVAFVDGIAYQIALRSKQRMTPSQLVKLTKPFLRTVRNADFVKPVWQVKELRSYKLPDGTFVSANKRKRDTFVVIKGANYARNEEISAQEAKIR